MDCELIFILFQSGELAKKIFKVPFLVHVLVEHSSRLSKVPLCVFGDEGTKEFDFSH